MIARRLRREREAFATMVRADPAFWKPGFWTSIVLAHLAQRHGAMQKLRELAPLIALVRGQSPRVVVEIGSGRGGTLYAWCRAAAADATIVSIDLPGGPFGGTDVPEDVLRGYGRPTQQLCLVRGDSHDPQTRRELEEILQGRKIDFLLIDGDHTYEGVRDDFELYAPFVGDGRPIAFHDILPHPQAPACEVERFWNEVKAGRRHLQFVDRQPDSNAQYGGIGVLFGGGDEELAPSEGARSA